MAQTAQFRYYSSGKTTSKGYKLDHYAVNNSFSLIILFFQTLKQNTEPVNDSVLDKKNKESVATQTPGRTNNRIQTAIVTSTRPIRTLVRSNNRNWRHTAHASLEYVMIL